MSFDSAIKVTYKNPYVTLIQKRATRNTTNEGFYIGVFKVENQHRQIKGYRELNEQEISLMNEIKQAGIFLGELVAKVKAADGIDLRFASIGQTELQLGLMALTRSVAKPEFF